MAFYRCGGGGIPSSLKTDMNAVLNKKFGTSSDYPPADWAPTVNLMGPLPERTASGSIAHITDGADEVPLKSWEVEIAPTLTGKTAIECTQTGKNLVNGGSGYTVLANATAQTLIGSCDLEANVDYTLSCSMTGTPTQRTRNRWAVAKSSNMWDGTAVFGNDFYVAPQQTFTPSESGTYYFFIWSQGIDVDVSYDDFMCEVGSTATTYEPYTAPTVSTVNLGRTIYGGTADVVNGEGTDENGNDFTFTPITPTPETALGVNNFWADEGDSEVTYRADINLALGGQ